MSDAPLRMLITAFEPSGDILAARLVVKLRERRPNLEVFALGGPHLREAGATLLEETTGHATMGLGAVAEVKTLRRRVAMVKRWLAENPIDVHVPVDSPAANWSFCKLVRGAAHAGRPAPKIVHLVAPQVWAWASWRVRRLRKWSDMVLCLLPFEPAWFAERGVPAVFVGHPLFERVGESHATEAFPHGEPKLALLPGSRSGEVQKNWADMLAAFEVLRHRHPGLSVVVAASDRDRAALIRRKSPGGRLPRGVSMSVGNASAVLDWADCAVVVSGTATLEAVSRDTPMIALYRVSPALWHTLGKLLVRTRTFTLPNILGEYLGLGRVVPELVPFFGGHEPIVAALEPLLRDGPARRKQHEGFAVIAEAFAGQRFGDAAAAGLLDVVGG